MLLNLVKSCKIIVMRSDDRYFLLNMRIVICSFKFSITKQFLRDIFQVFALPTVSRVQGMEETNVTDVPNVT